MSKLHSVITTELGVLLAYLFSFYYFKNTVFYNDTSDFYFVLNVFKILGVLQVLLFIIIFFRLIIFNRVKSGLPALQLTFQAGSFGILVLAKEFSIIYIVMSIIIALFSIKILVYNKDVHNKVFKTGEVFKYLSKRNKIILKSILLIYIISFHLFFFFSTESIHIESSGSVLSKGCKYIGPYLFLSFGTFTIGLLVLNDMPESYYKDNISMWLIFNAVSIIGIYLILKGLAIL